MGRVEQVDGACQRAAVWRKTAESLQAAVIYLDQYDARLCRRLEASSPLGLCIEEQMIEAFEQGQVRTR
ncbi:hypothetical protein GCM10028811_02920 [Uliginosibacterium sediminicola]